MNRRSLIRGGLVSPFAPLSASLLASLAACRDEGSWAAGMVPIKWDRDACARCGMVISDRRFAVQLRGGPKGEVFKFDDIGCAASWCAEKIGLHPWANDAATQLWVAEFEGHGLRWLDARLAHYVPGPVSPMGYNYAAYPSAQPGSVGFAAMSAQTSATFPAGCNGAPT